MSDTPRADLNDALRQRMIELREQAVAGCWWTRAVVYGGSATLAVLFIAQVIALAVILGR